MLQLLPALSVLQHDVYLNEGGSPACLSESGADTLRAASVLPCPAGGTLVCVTPCHFSMQCVPLYDTLGENAIEFVMNHG